MGQTTLLASSPGVGALQPSFVQQIASAAAPAVQPRPHTRKVRACGVDDVLQRTPSTWPWLGSLAAGACLAMTGRQARSQVLNASIDQSAQ
jgi:hypothetical protein